MNFSTNLNLLREFLSQKVKSVDRYVTRSTVSFNVKVDVGSQRLQ